MRQITLIVVLIGFFSVFECKGLKEEFTWTKISYVWPGSRESRSGYHQSSSSSEVIHFPENDGEENEFKGSYIFENNVPIGANRWKNKLFVTVPRRRPGIPSTLNFVWMNSTERHNVPLIPYPNWHVNQLEPTRDPDGFVSVYRIAIDPCDRLWMVDTGLIETPGNNTRIQPARLIIIDLHTDQIIRHYTFKPSDVTPRTTLANLAVDVTADTCDKAFAYIPDLSGYGLVVYDFQEDNSWRVAHNYFYLESLNGDLFIGGVHFQWPDGIFSISLSDVGADGYRTAYFHPMAGIHLFSVSTRILRSRELATRSYHGDDMKVVMNRGERTQTSGSDLHKPSGTLFFAFVNQNGVGCWNANKKPIKEDVHIVYKDDQKFIYPADLKIANDEVIVLTNSMPVFIYKGLNYSETNFRVWITKVSDAVKDTACAITSKPGYH